MLRSLVLAGSAALIALPIGCTSGTGLVQPPPPSEVGAELMIDSRGGTVAITDPASPLFGASVHIPAGAVATPTRIQIREGSVPEGSSAVLAGPIVELLPSGTTFAQPVEIVLPAHDGLDMSQVQASFFDEDAARPTWQSIDASGGTYADPVAEVGPQVVLRVDHFTEFAPTFRARRYFSVTSTLHDPFRATIIATRPLTETAFGFTFVTPRSDQIRVEGSAATGPAVFDVLDGQYLVRVEGLDGSDPRCLSVGSTSDNAAMPPTVTAAPVSPLCNPPVAQLTASSMLVRVGDVVDLAGSAISMDGSRISYFWNRTGGILPGGQGGAASGELVTTMWTATRVGTFDVYFTAYDAASQFGEARVTITVRGNERPVIDSFLATPVQLGPGAPEGSRMLPPMTMPSAELGLSLLEVVATDPDGDPLSFFWYHGLPGNYFDPATGTMLGRDPFTGLATDPTTRLPFTGAAVLYMAPPASFLCEGLPLGMWLGLHVTASDGMSVDRSWVMVGMECVEEPPPPSRDGSHCFSPAPASSNPFMGAYCYGVAGPFADWITAECNLGDRRAGAGPCPGAPDAGACVDTTTRDGGIDTNVYYGLSSIQAETVRTQRCSGPNLVWIYPYAP